MTDESTSHAYYSMCHKLGEALSHRTEFRHSALTLLSESKDAFVPLVVNIRQSDRRFVMRNPARVRTRLLKMSGFRDDDNLAAAKPHIDCKR